MKLLSSSIAQNGFISFLLLTPIHSASFVSRPTTTSSSKSFTKIGRTIASPQIADPIQKRNDVWTISSSVTPDNIERTDYELLSLPARPGRPLKVIIAGGGVGGLTAAFCMLKQGMDVTVYEKTAAFARFGGPIQFASNALSVLKAIDDTLFDRIMSKFTFTGTRVCGIKDGLRADGNFRMTDDSIDYIINKDAPADWFVKFPLKVRNEYLYRFMKSVFLLKIKKRSLLIRSKFMD
jgi:FAD binding domain